MICISAQLLHGAIRANTVDIAVSRGRSTAEWPPSPARLLAALVAGGGTGDHNTVGSDDSELLALEQAPPPHIFASADSDTLRTRLQDRFVVLDERAKNSVQDYPARTSALVRPGERVCPKSSVITYSWPDLRLGNEQYLALRRRAARVSYLGCADSPVRLVVTDSSVSTNEATWEPADHGDATVSVPYAGYLNELDSQFERFQSGESPRASRVRRRYAQYRSPTFQVEASQPRHIWLSFESPFNGRHTMGVAEALRNAIMKQYDALGFGEAPTVLHGHGVALGDQHARFVPLPRAGDNYANGRIYGAAVVLPADTDAALRQRVEIAAAHVRQLYLRGGKPTSRVSLRDQSAPRPWATNPQRWTREAFRFVSATPVVHERFGEVTKENEVEVVAQWCANAGLPKPVAARVARVPFMTGVPRFTARDVWRSGSTKGYPFSHVEVIFDEPVAGPVAIGRGRTFGLGLLVPRRSPVGAGEEVTADG